MSASLTFQIGFNDYERVIKDLRLQVTCIATKIAA